MILDVLVFERCR